MNRTLLILQHFLIRAANDSTDRFFYIGKMSLVFLVYQIVVIIQNRDFTVVDPTSNPT